MVFTAEGNAKENYVCVQYFLAKNFGGNGIFL
jgi:hypothetical protein